MIEVFKVPLDKDLSAFTKQLWELKIPHRVVFEQSQILIADKSQNVEFIYQLFLYCHEHDSFPQNIEREFEKQQLISQTKSPSLPSSSRKVDFKKIPLVLALLIISILMSIAVDFGENTQLLSYFTVTDFQLFDNKITYTSLVYNFESFEIWRFISPIFIHFNFPHIAFNGLWVWIVGTVIEQRHNSLSLLLIVCLSGVASNIAQYLVSGPIFGGLSGVVYAIISYAWLWDKLNQDKLNVVSNALMGFMMVWLVLGYTGLLGKLGLGNIANTAHLVGLICGLLAVPCLAFSKRLSQRKT